MGERQVWWEELSMEAAAAPPCALTLTLAEPVWPCVGVGSGVVIPASFFSPWVSIGGLPQDSEICVKEKRSFLNPGNQCWEKQKSYFTGPFA